MIFLYLPNSIETRVIFDEIKYQNKLFKVTNNTFKYQSTLSTPQENNEITRHSKIALQSLITKANSYLYNYDEDENDNIGLNRIKRDSKTFVCKSENHLCSFVYYFIYFVLMILEDGYLFGNHYQTTFPSK